MPWGKPPDIYNGGDEIDPHLEWDYWEAELPPEALFGELHDRFNTTTIPIQGFHTFHKDVAEISRKALSPEQFFSDMEERKQQRLKELHDAVRPILNNVDWLTKHSYFNSEQACTFISLNQTGSFSCLLKFLASFIPPNCRERIGMPLTMTESTVETNIKGEKDSPSLLDGSASSVTTKDDSSVGDSPDRAVNSTPSSSPPSHRRTSVSTEAPGTASESPTEASVEAPAEAAKKAPGEALRETPTAEVQVPKTVTPTPPPILEIIPPDINLPSCSGQDTSAQAPERITAGNTDLARQERKRSPPSDHEDDEPASNRRRSNDHIKNDYGYGDDVETVYRSFLWLQSF